MEEKHEISENKDDKEGEKEGRYGSAIKRQIQNAPSVDRIKGDRDSKCRADEKAC